MLLLGRTSIAALRHPTVPYLSLRSFRGPTRLGALRSPCSTSWTGLQRPRFATKARKGGQNKRDNEGPSDGVQNKEFFTLVYGRPRRHSGPPILDRFYEACKSRNVAMILQLYPSVIGLRTVPREMSWLLVQALHAHIRVQRDIQARTVALLPFLERVTEDIRSGKLPVRPTAIVHLLGIYKEGKLYEEGYAFWQWLAGQDDSFLSPAVYGAAIELLAYRGKDSLQVLEDLYVDSLKRFPGTFAEYHLSPEAIVPDRTQLTNIPGTNATLLQGILTARLLNRDWKNAYLALDTALRLYPTTVPSRFFQLFFHERSLSEGYTVFLVACRSGVLLSPKFLTELLTKLKTAMPILRSLRERSILVRAAANAIYAYLESGGAIEGRHIPIFVDVFGSLLAPKNDDIKYTENEIVIRNQIVTAAHNMMTTLMQAGLAHHRQLYLSMLRLAAHFQARELFTAILRDMKTARIDLYEIDRRAMLYTAGAFRDEDLIRRFWGEIVSQAEIGGSQLHAADWITFARVCRRSNCQKLFEDQLQSLTHAIDEATEKAARSELVEQERKPREHPFELMEPADFDAVVEEIASIMRNAAAVIMAGQPLDLQKTPFSMFLDPHRRPLGSEEDLRAVYDEFTTDPHQPPPPKDESQVLPTSSTGIPLDELRFQNWVSVLELMAEAEDVEARFQRRLDEAIASGQPLDKIRYPVEVSTYMPSTLNVTSKEEINPPSRIQLKDMVRRLRGPYTSQPVNTLKASSN